MTRDTGLPQPQLDAPEELWLESLYRDFCEGRRSKKRLLIGELGERLPDDFSPEDIDERVVGGADHITPLGIWLVDPGSIYLRIVDQILCHARELALTEPEIPEIQVEALAEELGVSHEDASRACDIISMLDLALTSGSSRGRLDRGLTRTLDVDRRLDRLLDYEGVEEEIARNASERTDASRTGAVLDLQVAEPEPGAVEGIKQQVSDALTGRRYRVPREHFRKAMKFYSEPDRDLPNCVKESVTAVEGMLKVVSDQDAGSVKSMVTKLEQRDLIGGRMKSLLDKMWAYANQQPGARHAGLEVPKQSEPEAAFVLNTAAATLLMLKQVDPMRR